MPNTTQIYTASWAVVALLVGAGALVYSRMARRLAREGGKVEVASFDLPELLMSIVFASFFTLLTVSACLGPAKTDSAVKIETVLPNSALFILFTVGIGAFIRYRGVKLRTAFGLDRLTVVGVSGWALGLLVAAFPLLQVANYLTAAVMHGDAQPQPLVDLFNTAARHHDFRVMGIIGVSAVLIQPACEEFLFRGFFYGVWKRYLGPLGSGFLASLLFAAFHTSAAAFAGLFTLAVCLNIAYERTGSLFVPILMHALFNFVSLLVLFSAVQSPAPS